MAAHYNKSESLEYIKTSIADRELEHEIELFASGCFMIDIWIQNDMISIQLENDSVGLSIMKEGETVEFTSVPDERYTDNGLFIKRLEQLLDQYDDNVKMNRTTKIVRINSHSQFPTVESIRDLSRSQTLKLVFEDSINDQREKIGEQLKKQLDGFQVGIHTTDPEINISKLITDKEIEDHQLFFEKCAKDYRKLSQELIFQLANKLKIEINPNFPLLSFNPFKNRTGQTGTINNWRYFLHGFHCGFENKKTGQVIEVPLVFGLEFGDLDPYFFMYFITSTPEYQPLPIEIYEHYSDGVRINEKMIALGKFEPIGSNIQNHFGIVVADREKVEIKLYNPPKEASEKFNIWKFLGLK